MSKSQSMGLFKRRGLALLIAGGLLWAGSLPAQVRDDYKVAEDRDKSHDILPGDNARAITTKKTEVRNLRNAIVAILQGGSGAMTKDQEKELDKWYNTYEFPILTLYDPEELKSLAESKTDLYEGRKRLFRDQIERATSKDAHDRVVKLAFDFFSKVAKEDYHPAVRYNAMLIIGELNARELDRAGTNSVPPLPLRTALNYMLEEFRSPEQIDAVRVAALIGIQRHIQLDAQAVVDADMIPEAQVAEARKLALDLVNTRQAPAGRSQPGHDWMRRRGLEILSWIARARLDQEIVDLIVARLSDGDEERGVRCEAAIALNTVSYLPDSKNSRHRGGAKISIKPRDVAAELVRFVVDGTKKDIEQVDQYLTSLEEAEEIYSGSGGSGRVPSASPRSSRKDRAAGGSGGARGGRYAGYPGAMGGARGGAGMYGQVEAADPYAFRIEPVYRRLRYEIGCAMRGLRGTDEWRKGDPTVPGGLYKLWPKAEDGTPLTPVTPAIQADKDYLAKAAASLKALADKLKVKPEELTTEDFTLEKLAAPGTPGKDPAPLAMMTKVVDEVLVRAKPKATDAKDPLKEPDPAAEEAPVPMKPAKPMPAAEPEESEPAPVEAKPAKPKVPDPIEGEPAPVEAAAPAPAKPAKPKTPDPAE